MCLVILYGGTGGEAEVSKNTALSIVKALEELNYEYKKLEFSDTWIQDIINLNPSFVFIAMHGSPGEDGTVQAVLDSLNIAYNGSSVLASSLAMNKSMSKKIFSDCNIPVAQEKLLKVKDISEKIEDLGMELPLVLKPNDGGSSVDIKIIKTIDEWDSCYEFLKNLNQESFILVEKFIAGRELTVPIFNNKAVGVMEIVSNNSDFYDYSAKYSEGGSKHLYPASIATEVYNEMCVLALKAHKSLGCEGVTRVDFRYDELENRIVILEINTLPGMTNVSLLPEVLKNEGISFTSLVDWIIKDGKCRQKVKA